jgi:hypothetical protein
LNVAFRQRSATVRTGVADGIVSSLHIEEGYFLASIVNGAAWPGGTSLVLAILRSFAIMRLPAGKLPLRPRDLDTRRKAPPALF